MLVVALMCLLEDLLMNVIETINKTPTRLDPWEI